MHIQFHQFGIEHIGSAHPHSDVEVIDFAYQFLRELGIPMGEDESGQKSNIVVR
jgi:histidyl-tRNA synthetase